MSPGINTGDDTYPLMERRSSSIMLNGLAAKVLATVATVLLPIMLAGMWWVVEGNTATRIALVELNSKLSGLSTEIAGLRQELNSRTDDRYRASDAQRDFRLRDQEINEIKRRLSHQEEKK